MRAPALLFIGALLAAVPAASPAHADFFDDLGDALGKLGNAVDDALTQKPEQPKPEAAPAPVQPAPPAEWAAPAIDNANAQAYTVTTTLPPALPAAKRAQLSASPQLVGRTTAELNNAALNRVQGVQPVQPAPAQAAAPQAPTLYTTPAANAPAPAANTPLGMAINSRRGPAVMDDAPAPNRAPRRAAVSASLIAPLPGFSEAAPRAAATYNPSLNPPVQNARTAADATANLNRQAAAAIPAPVAPVAPAPVVSAPTQVAANIPAPVMPVPPKLEAPIVAPVAAPVSAPTMPAPPVVQAAAPVAAASAMRSFTVSYGRQKATVSDALLRNAASASPTSDTQKVISALAAALKRDGTQRVRLRAQAMMVDNRMAEARRRSFERAQLVKDWLEEAGARPTQIDLEVLGAGEVDSVTLALYNP